MIASFLAFLGVSAIVIMTPGPDTAVTVRNTLLGGRFAGILTALGISTGQAIWALATSFGVVALLVWLGVNALIAAWRGTGDEPVAGAQVRAARLRPGRAFLQGLISDLGNPKMAVFFASLLPQFATPGEGLFAALMSLGLVFSLMTFAWLVAYAFVIAKAGEVLRRPVIRRWLEAVTGTLLVALGLRIATERS